MTKLIILLLFLSSFAFAQEHHVKMGATFFKENSKNYIAVSLKNDKKWHTYWKNPGDAGIPIKIEFFINNKKIKLNELEWPKPTKYIEQGDILAFGYSNTNHFYFEIPDSKKNAFKNNTVTIKGQWLVCKDICIPGSDELTIAPSADLLGKSHPYDINFAEIKKSFSKLPAVAKIPVQFEIYLTKAKDDNRLALQYTFSGIDIKNFSTKDNLLMAFPAPPFDYKHEKLYYDQKNKTLYGRTYIDWDGIYDEPEWPLPEGGVFKRTIKTKFLLNYSKNVQPIVIEYDFNQFSMTGDQSLDTFLKTLTPISANKKISSGSTSLGTSESETSSIFYVILFAFLGGLILNLMPCVLPVISLKLFGLVVHSDEPKSKIVKHNLAYSAGVLFSFMVLAVFVLMLKSSGEKFGWGFQLQSPMFVFTMIIVIFVMALNMFGLFEFVTPGGKALGNAEIKKGISGDFINGILATILSTPCSAPFLGTALSFAFTTSDFNTFLILFFVGLGLASPFLLTAIFPGLIRHLPKPGMWMEKLKYFLGFTLLLTAVWLYDVLVNLVDFSFSGIYINMILASLFFAFFVRRFITKIFVWNIIFFILPVIATMTLVNHKGLDIYYPDTATSSIRTTNGLKWDKWSLDRMQELANDKKWVFIDFTAKWCLTCKVNKKIVLETDSFKKFVKEKQISLLIADWTKRDDYITDFLRSYKIVGVPAYFIQKPNGEIIHLGETISMSKIKKYIK